MFDKLWDKTISLSIKRRQIEHGIHPESNRKITDDQSIQEEIISLLEQAKRNLSIFSLLKTHNLLFFMSQFDLTLSNLLNRGVRIRISSDNTDKDIQNTLNFINGLISDNKVELLF